MFRPATGKICKDCTVTNCSKCKDDTDTEECEKCDDSDFDPATKCVKSKNNKLNIFV